ncbi:MAG: WYL domain-containing protein [Bacteroidales bacterium]|nr:WYL domain-containing protein [Bacteroidales bacterium]
MDQPKIERMLRLMMMLTSNNRYTIEELGEKLDTSPRTIYRYLDTFKEAGFVVSKKGNYFRLDRKSRYFKDISQLVHFTEEEAYILNSAIESLDPTNAIKQNLKAKLASIYDFKMLAECVVKGDNARNVNAIIEAIENRKQIILHNYTSAHSRQVSDRVVEPMSFTTNYIQVWAYEVSSGRNKLFKLSRIGKVEILDKEWEFEQEHKEGLMDLFRINSFEQIPVKLKLGIRAASLLVEEYPLGEKYISPLPDDPSHFILDTWVCGYEGVGRFVLGLLDDIEIIEGDGLKAFLKERMSLAKY